MPDIESKYRTALSDDIVNEDNTFRLVYAPYGYKPIHFDDNFTMYPGEAVETKLDANLNQWVIKYQQHQYRLDVTSNYQFKPSNAQFINDNQDDDTIKSLYGPNDSQALVPEDYTPMIGSIWMQIDKQNQLVQYYVFTDPGLNQWPVWKKANIRLLANGDKKLETEA